jgi:2-keto-4-pentenoate hydratase/2-oxohepta-3-ene-1,7-dioic acid hydratase in catechol pathway
MKLARYRFDSAIHVVLVEEDGWLVDLGPSSGEANELPQLIENPGIVASRRSAPMPLHLRALMPPIAAPQKFLAIGMNYAEHRREIRENSSNPELGEDKPTQVWFNKQVSCINAPFAPIILPKVSRYLDYEGELAFVIGRRGRHIAEKYALDHVAGYMICNDISVRDWQRASPTMTMGKSFDTHGPIGPWLVSADEIADPQSLEIVTTLNGQERQRFSTDTMIASCAEMIAHLSKAFTLEPGDIISTGTGAGVGALSIPKYFMQADDRVRVEIEKIGFIEATIFTEQLA